MLHVAECSCGIVGRLVGFLDFSLPSVSMHADVSISWPTDKQETGWHLLCHA